MELDDTIHEIGRDIGLDVWYVYEEGERHMIPDPVLIGFASAILTTYLTKFIGVEEIALKHRAMFLDFVEQVRSGEFTSNQSHLAAIAEIAPAVTDHAAAPEAFERARTGVRDQLQAAGIPRSRSERHAAAVEKAAIRHFHFNP
jgi:hypothetical protein